MSVLADVGRSAVLAMIAVAAWCLAGSAARAAPTFEIAAYGWNTLPSGSIYTRYAGIKTPPVDLRKDLAMGRHLNAGMRFTWRQPRRLIPNVTLEYVHMVANGGLSLKRNIEWEGTTYVVSGFLLSQVDLRDGGVEMFWDAVDNPVITVQPGLEAQWYSLHVPFAGLVSEQQPIPATYSKAVSVGVVSWVPLIDVRLAFSLPYRFRLYVKGSYFPHRRGQDYVYDLRGGLSYRFDRRLMLFTGWRRFRLHIDNGSLTVNGDLEFKGIYAGLGYVF